MKVGVIAAELTGERTGVGRYLEGLLGGLERWDHGAEWHLFLPGPTEAAILPDDRRVVVHRDGHGGNRALWEQVRLPRELARNGVDVVFGPAYSLPIRLSVPAVVTLHDLSFELLPEEFRVRERWRRRIAARVAARRADRVLTDTASMAELVKDRYRLPDHRVAVIPLAIDRGRFSPPPDPGDAAILNDLGARAPYLLWVGTVLERRCPRAVLEAFAKLRERRSELQLVIAGANRMRRPERLRRWIGDLGLLESVVAPGWVREEALAPLYRHAELGIYVSRHEGFGIPPLECLACGTPVVVSHGLALDELWPDYPFRCAGTEASKIAEAMGSALADGERARTVAGDAGGVLDRLDWERSARLLVDELRNVVRR